EGTPCPVSRPVSTSHNLRVGTGVKTSRVYLPLVKRAAAGSAASAMSAVKPPSQVAGLSGTTFAAATRLEWRPNPSSDDVDGYHIYRSPLGETAGFQRLATLPGDVHVYTDTVVCGYVYFVTAFNRAGESPPSTTSYATLPCRE